MSAINDFNKILLLTSKGSWFFPFACAFQKQLAATGCYQAVDLFSHHKKVSGCYDVVFLLSYFNIVDSAFLGRHRFNLVVHASPLPKGRGMAPFFWQILERKKRIPFLLFEATSELDKGDIYIKDEVSLRGDELHNELRQIQIDKMIELSVRFLREYPKLKPVRQRGKPTYYPKRTPADSRLDINKTIKEQFNLLRIVDNENYPAFFEYQGKRYYLKISKDDR